jgi:hypothetical protein
MAIDKDSFRCGSCEHPALNTTGGWNEVEPGVAFMMCADCYKPKKDPYPERPKVVQVEEVEPCTHEGGNYNTGANGSMVCADCSQVI